MARDKFTGVNLKWNYDTGEVNCSMPEYIPILMSRLYHQLPPTK